MPANEQRQDFAREAERLTELLREAGALALKTFRGELRSWFKNGSSPVSEADMAIDAFLRARLPTPDDGWLSEESKDDASRLSKRRVYIVDPIDGTRAYIAGLPDWSISAALVENGRPVVAALYAPVEDEMFSAHAGGGARLNGRPLTASDSPSLAGARIAGPPSYLKRMARLAPGIVALPRIHSLALRMARVAQGRVDISFASPNSNEWDLAAADLLVHEAGGAITDFTGKPLVYNRALPVHDMLVGAGRTRHQTVLDLTRQRWKETF